MQSQQWFVFLKDGTVVLTNHQQLLDEQAIEAFKPYWLRQFYLGTFHQVTYYCAEIQQVTPLLQAFQIVPFRSVLATFVNERYGIAVKAYSVLNWDRHHQYCGCCGGKTQHQSQAFERVCPECHLSFFPRISPSIIVRIQRGDEILMARSPHFLPGAYGLIAGFVDIGESLEEAVHREVQEEVGISIKNLAYFQSQPWPFPDSLMMAFTAEYASGELIIDNNELEAAGWYRYNQLPGRPSMATSISSKLIDDFIAQCNDFANTSC